MRRGIIFSSISELIKEEELNFTLVNESFVSESDKISWDTYKRVAISEFERCYRIYEEIKQKLHKAVIKNAVERYKKIIK